MGGFVWAVRSGLVWPPFDPGAAARYYDFMPYILHLPWKEEVLVDAPKRSVYQLSLWLSCHIPPRCRWSVPGPQYARTSPNQSYAKFVLFTGVHGRRTREEVVGAPVYPVFDGGVGVPVYPNSESVEVLCLRVEVHFSEVRAPPRLPWVPHR